MPSAFRPPVRVSLESSTSTPGSDAGTSPFGPGGQGSAGGQGWVGAGLALTPLTASGVGGSPPGRGNHDLVTLRGQRRARPGRSTGAGRAGGAPGRKEERAVVTCWAARPPARAPRRCSRPRVCGWPRPSRPRCAPGTEGSGPPCSGHHLPAPSRSPSVRRLSRPKPSVPTRLRRGPQALPAAGKSAPDGVTAGRGLMTTPRG